MKRATFTLLLPLLVMLLAQSAVAQPPRAPDAETIAANCMQMIAARSEARAAFNAARAEQAAAQIAVLVENDMIPQAFALAHNARQLINHRSFQTVQLINHRAQQCIALLMFLERPDLAQQVHAARVEAVQAIGQSRQDAIATIQAALPTPE